MAVSIDTIILTLLLRPAVRPPNDPSTGEPVVRAAERIEHLIEQFRSSDTRVLIPATAWAEFLVVADEAAQEYLALVKGRSYIEIVSFDQISAVEAALDTRKALKEGNKQKVFDGTRECVKADRQIMAIAKTRAVDMAYSGDADIVRIGASMNVPVTPLWKLPLPQSSTPLLDD